MRPEVNAFAMRQGLILGCVFAVNFVAGTMPSIAFISWVVELVILWYVYKCGVKCREEIMEGEMSYGAGVWFILQLFLYSSMVAGVFKYIYLKWIDSKYLAELRVSMEELFRTAKMPMDEATAVMNDLLTPESMALYSIGADAMLGLFVGLLMSVILKRSNK